MSVLESTIENTVCNWGKANNFLTPKVKFVENGYPDRLFISPFGGTIFIEFKRPGEVPSPLQLYRIGQLTNRGIPAFWSDNSYESISKLNAALGSSRLPEASNSTPIEAGVRRVVSGPWPRQDVNMPSGVQDSKGQESSEEDAYNRAASALLQSLAGRDKEVGELLKPAMDYFARGGQRRQT